MWGCFCMYVCPWGVLSVLLYLWCGFCLSKNALCTCSTDQDRTEEVVSQIWDCVVSIFLLVFVSFFLLALFPSFFKFLYCPFGLITPFLWCHSKKIHHFGCSIFCSSRCFSLFLWVHHLPLCALGDGQVLVGIRWQNWIERW